MASRQKTDYFDRLTVQSEYSLKASRLLRSFLGTYEMSDIFRIRSDMEELHKASYSQSRDILSALETDFLPPLDREDIFSLSVGILKSAETFCDAFRYIYTYNNAENKSAVRLATTAEECCFTLHSAVSGLKNFRKSDRNKSFFEEIEALRIRSDEEYFKAMERIYSETADARRIFCAANIYNAVRKCCDTCNDTVILLDTAVMKNV